MYRLSPPPKSLSQMALERQNAQREFARKRLIDLVASLISAFFIAMLIIWLTCRFVWG